MLRKIVNAAPRGKVISAIQNMYIHHGTEVLENPL
jgi:hypothetical protein